MKLSIIVPIYNSEEFIEDCVKSILHQPFDDYELILVDDGSSDNSLTICKKYSNLPNVKVIHESNGGVSKARNTGIESAEGKYIYFVDSDDIMCSKALKNISADFNHKYDMIFGNFVSWDYLNSRKEIWNDISKIDVKPNDSINVLCERYAKKDAQIPWNPYQAFYKKSILEKANLRFDEKLTVGEDCDFFFRYIKYVKSFKIESQNLVLYRIDANSNSLIRSFNYNNIMSQLRVFTKLYNEADYFENKELMETYFATRFTNVVILIGNMDDKIGKRKCIGFVKDHVDLIYRSRNATKYKILQYINRTLGLRTAIDITSIIRQVVIRRRKR